MTPTDYGRRESYRTPARYLAKPRAANKPYDLSQSFKTGFWPVLGGPPISSLLEQKCVHVDVRLETGDFCEPVKNWTQFNSPTWNARQQCRYPTSLRVSSRTRTEPGPSWSCSQAVSKPVRHIPLMYVQRKTPDDRQRNCPKHVEFYSKNKFVKLVHLVGFIIRIYHDARSPERQVSPKYFAHSCVTWRWPSWLRHVAQHTKSLKKKK